jgi:hypothetical protein
MTKKNQIVFILLALANYACTPKKEIRVYLIKQGYEGPLISIQNDSTSKDIFVNNDTLFFDFRKSFVARGKGSFIEGTFNSSDIKYYYVDSLGRREQIDFLFNKKKYVNEEKVYVYPMYAQIRVNSQCDLISSHKNLNYYLEVQQKLCDSLLSIRVSN